MEGKVLVTGATGFIGIEVAKQLSHIGVRPRLLVRRPLRATILHSFNAEVIQGDLESPESLARAVEGMEIVIHLGARAIFEEYSRVRPTIVEGSIALMEACIAAGVKQLIYSSSLLVYEGQVQPIDQETPATSRLGYGRAKIEAEQGLSSLARDSDIKLAMIRLPHVYGARDLMFDQVRQSRVVFPGNGRNLFAHLHVEDAARVLLAAAERGWNGTSPVADNQAVDWNDFFDVIKKYYPRFQSIAMPKSLALLGTYILTPLRRLDRFPSLYTPDAVRSWNMNLQVKQGLLWNELGISPNYPSVYAGIPAVLDECVEFRWIHPVADRRG